MNFGDLQREVQAWSSRNFPDAEPIHPLLGMQEELGEISHAYLKRIQGIRGTPEEHTAAIEDGVADLTVFIADFCWRNGISYQAVVGRTWAKVRERDWQSDPLNGWALAGERGAAG